VKMKEFCCTFLIDGNHEWLLEDMSICMSKCAPNVVNGTGVRSVVSWMPDGVSLIRLIHQEIRVCWSLY